MSAGVYRYWTADGELLYVGRSENLMRRLLAHEPKEWITEAANITVEWYETRDQAIHAEYVAILRQPGRYNVSHSEMGNRSGEARRQARLAAHAAGEDCHRINCVRCSQMWPRRKGTAA